MSDKPSEHGEDAEDPRFLQDEVVRTVGVVSAKVDVHWG